MYRKHNMGTFPVLELNVCILTNVMFLAQKYDLRWSQNESTSFETQKKHPFWKRSWSVSCELRVSCGVIIFLYRADGKLWLEHVYFFEIFGKRHGEFF